MSESVTERAYAKVNLTLEVIGKRPDGFHNLASVIQTISLHDDLVVAEDSELSATSDDPTLGNEDDLALAAARALREATGINAGARIFVKKRIPIAAGLGGGSADAAAALRALNRLWGLGLGNAQLAKIGATVGSDVPFLVTGGTGLIQGRGDDFTALPAPSIPRILILSPGLSPIGHRGKTAEMFSRIGKSMYTRGSLTHKLAARIRAGSDCPPEFMFNIFQSVVADVFPDWNSYHRELAGLGAREIILSGAGPSMFTVPPSREIGTAWQLLLERVRGWRVHVAQLQPPIDAGP